MQSNVVDVDYNNANFCEIQMELNFLEVLFSNTKDSTFVFITETDSYFRNEVTYMGDISTTKNKKLGFVLSIYYFGIDSVSLRGNSKLHIYDIEKGKIGFYCFGSAGIAPTRLLEHTLHFEFNDEFCNNTTEISFEDSIPQEFFVFCSKEYGDFYSFQKNVYNFDDFSFLKQYLLKK